MAPDCTAAGIASCTGRASSQASNQRLGSVPSFTAAQHRLYSSRHRTKKKCRQTLQQGSHHTQVAPDFTAAGIASKTSAARLYSSRDRVRHKNRQTVTAGGIASHTSSARLYSSRDRITHKSRQTLHQQASHHTQVAPVPKPAIRG